MSVVLLCPCNSWADDCLGQDYDSDEQPDFACPSPEEDLLVPRMELPASLAVDVGETVEAPFAGALVARERLEVLGLRLKAVRRLRWLDRQQNRLHKRIQQTAARQVHDAQIAQLTSHRNYYRDLAETAVGREKWYKSYWFGFLTGAVVTVGLVVAAIYFIAEIESHAGVET